MLEERQKNQGLLRGVKQALKWVIGPHRGPVPVILECSDLGQRNCSKLYSKYLRFGY